MEARPLSLNGASSAASPPLCPVRAELTALRVRRTRTQSPSQRRPCHHSAASLVAPHLRAVAWGRGAHRSSAGRDPDHSSICTADPL